MAAPVEITVPEVRVVAAGLLSEVSTLAQSMLEYLLERIPEAGGDPEIEGLTLGSCSSNIEAALSMLRHGIPVSATEAPVTALEHARAMAARGHSVDVMLRLRECGMPDDVFQVVTGRGGAVGDALIDNVDMVMFTGSTETGRKVAVRAAERLIPASLELGGKDPLIVLADADVERAANHAAYYSMFNCGQTCISIERCYVEAPVYDEFVAGVVARVEALRQCRPAGPGSTDVGSMTVGSQVDVVEAHVRDALARGATALTGGNRGHEGEPGHWFEPTVLVDVTHDMECMREETFGPTLPIMKVADAEEAVRLANDSTYGLCAAIFSRDLKRAEGLARRIRAGAVTINDALINYAALELPMGGATPESGIGHRHGPGGIRKYCRQQSLLVSRFHPRRDFHMHPYSAARTKRFARLFRLLYRRTSP